MINSIYFLFGLIIGGIIVYFISAQKKDLGGTGIVAEQHAQKVKNKEAILSIFETQSPLTNNHVEQLLGISDATATRYLEELEKEGKVRQVGGTGRGVHYERV